MVYAGQVVGWLWLAGPCLWHRTTVKFFCLFQLAVKFFKPLTVFAC